MKTDLVKGFRDYTGKEAEKKAFIEEVIRRTFEKYNYENAQTPIIEYEEFVKGENSDDEAISDIFKLKDKGKRKLALRYEFTFQLKRIAQNKKLPYKRFQIGQVFRDEPVSQNRLRQFTQCDIDVVGSTIKEEAEILKITKEILNALKIDSVIYINNRKLLNEILDELKIKEKEQTLREIDKMDKIPKEQLEENLKKLKAEKVLEVLNKQESFFKKYNSFKEIEELQKYCKDYSLNVKFAPFLVRGLSYYDGTVFEIKSKIKETICGGGSYSVGKNPSTGISLGIERLMAVSNILLQIEKILVVSLNQDKEAITIANNLRAQGKNVSIYYGKPSKALDYANSYDISKVLFVGAKEVKEKKFKVKDMKTGTEKIMVFQKVSKKNILFKKN